MQTKTSSLPKRTWSWIKARFQTRRSKIIGSIVLIVLIIIVATHKSGPTYQFVAVTRGPITETVSITGNTVPVESVSLGFNSTGIVSKTYTKVGEQVHKGDVIATLESGDLYAQAKQAEANVSTQEAKLAGLRAGTRPEDIAASQAALEKSRQDLTNYYTSISDTSNDAYAKASDAIRVQLDPMFFDDEGTKPQLTYTSGFPSNIVTTERLDVTAILNSWSNTPSEGTLSKAISDMEKIRVLITDTGKTLDATPNLSDTEIASYKAAITVAQTEVTTAAKALSTLSQNIASQKLTVAQLQSQLDLKNAGTTPEDIAAQEAQVASAKAGLDSMYARLGNNRIVAPIDGTVTQFDAKIGQLAATGSSLVSIISSGSFEVEGLISEIDIGKVAVGNPVSMTLDAFQGEVFTGSIYYIDPAQTTTDGVVGYKVKVKFDTDDPRIKSGLTANIDIKTRSKSSALILPQYAVLQNDEGIFVQKLVNVKKNGKGGTVENAPVTLGLQDQDGNVEIVSGITDGEQVINIGLKQK